MSQDNADSLLLLLEKGYIGHLNLIVSDYFYWNYHKDLVPYMLERFPEDKWTFAVAGEHTKVAQMQLSNGKFLVFHGSANLRSSANVEQFAVHCDRELYIFNQEWMEIILEDYKLNKKALRVKRLWEKIKNE
jgi:hypothetical protein